MGLLVAVLAGVVLTTAVLPRPPGPPAAGRLRRAAARRWRAQLQLWDTVLSQDGWRSDGGRPADGDTAPLHWVGSVLEGSVLPGPPR